MSKIFLTAWLAALILAWSGAPALAGGRVMEVSADEMAADYLSDPEAAERKYRRKTLQISGLAHRFHMTVETRDWPSITLGGRVKDDYRGISIDYLFSRSQPDEVIQAVMKMVRGERVTVTCTLRETGLKGYANYDPGTCGVRR